MEIPLGRQEELTNALVDTFSSYLGTHIQDINRRLTLGKVSPEELEWMSNKTVDMFLTSEEEFSTMSGNALVVKAAGKLMDDEYLKIAAGERDGYLAFAFAEGGAITSGNMIKEESKTNNLKTDVEETSEEKKDIAVHLMFAGEVDTEESKQPFETLTDDEGRALAVTFIEGTTQDFGDVESPHSKEWRAHQHYLTPKILKIYNNHGQDLEKTVNELKELFTKNEMLSSVFPGTEKDTRGEITILFQDGQSINMVKGDRHKKYEWGETSLAFGYEAKAINPEKTEAVKSGLLGKAKTSVPVTGKATSTVVEGSKLIKPDTAVAEAFDRAKVCLPYMVIPPKHRLSSNQSAESWYTSYADPTYGMPSSKEINEMKNNQEKAVAVRIKPTINEKSFRDLIQKNMIVQAPNQAASKPATEAKKDEIIVPTLIVPKKELEQFKLLQAKVTKEPGVMVFKPDAIIEASVNSKLIAATDQLGLPGLSSFHGWYEAFGELVRTDPVAAQALLVQFSTQHYLDQQAIEAATKQIKKAM